MADYYIGEIICTGFSFHPKNFLPCDGGLVLIRNYTALFAILGTNFGGDGRDYFGLPDLRGVVPIGFGQGPGLTDRWIGDTGGAPSHTLNVNELPAHRHPLASSGVGGSATSPVNKLFAPSLSGDFDYAPPAAATLGMTSADAGALGPFGGNQAHQNLQPTLACMFSICYSGPFPPRP